MTTQGAEGRSKRRSAVLLSLAVGVSLSAVVILGGTAPQAEAAFTEKVVFASDRTTGTGVNNPTGDSEIFKMNPDGTGVKQLTFNEVTDSSPALSPDGKKVVYDSYGNKISNPEGDREVYVMNALDGKGKKNLSNNGAGVYDDFAVFSSDGKKVAYESDGIQPSNPEGESEVYVVNALDGLGKKNLSNNGVDIIDYDADFSPDGQKVAYTSGGVQTSNPEGDEEIYRMKVLDGTGKKNLTNNGTGLNEESPDFSPDGKKIAYWSSGKQISNPEGDPEIYMMDALDGTGQKNLTDNGLGVTDTFPIFAPGGKKILYESLGIQPSNPEGDYEVYVVNVLDGKGKKNLSNNGTGVTDDSGDFSLDGTKVTYHSRGSQTSNPEGDEEIYRMKVLDGTGKKNLTNNGTGVDDYNPDWGVQGM